jgi:hypothetical protein
MSILDWRDEIGKTVHHITLNSLNEQIHKLIKKKKKVIRQIKSKY